MPQHTGDETVEPNAPARPTISDIARRAGVSKGAVSFALNGRPGVSADTRGRILRIAEELNWRPHRAARALSGARTDSVGLVFARPARTLGVEPFFAHLLSGLQAGLSAEGIALQLLIVEDTEAEIDVYHRWASEHRVDGLVLVDLKVDDPRIPAVEQLGLPAIILGGSGPHDSLSSVWADDHAAMTSIIDYLGALGHTRLAHIAGVSAFAHTQERVRALQEGTQRLALEHVQTVHTDFSDSEGASTTRRLLSGRPRPSAIIYDSDVMAVAGLGVAMEMGVSVPGELSIISFDDSVLTQLMHPALTALTRDTYALGIQVAEALMSVISDPHSRWHVQADTPSLVVRESTAPAA
ncbi:LacI family DNA-binding transcriptional regulator [Phytoactinopolyspora mesophila]|uniref:LacI family DNA-binding transcriptional regulator n=1 Tax=Phytoactinopolyspora mesophila TaxID=2650750 RepID=UPI001C9E4719